LAFALIVRKPHQSDILAVKRPTTPTELQMAIGAATGDYASCQISFYRSACLWCWSCGVICSCKKNEAWTLPCVQLSENPVLIRDQAAFPLARTAMTWDHRRCASRIAGCFNLAYQFSCVEFFGVPAPYRLSLQRFWVVFGKCDWCGYRWVPVGTI